MDAPYRNDTGLRSPLFDVAQRLSADLSVPCRLNPLILMSDLERTPDIVSLAEQLPEKSALIYRHFGADERSVIARQLREITGATDVQFLIGNDPELARQVKADGVHFPRRASADMISPIRQTFPDWILTQAAPKPFPTSILSRFSALDAVFFSSVFVSQSPSSGTPVGVRSLSQVCHCSPIPVIALGGVTEQTAPALIGTGAAGLAAIGGLASALRDRKTFMSTQKDEPITASPGTTVTIERKDTIRGHVFIATVEGEDEKGELSLRSVREGVFNAHHTGVPSEIGGRGIGKALVQAMAEDAKANGYKVIPGCPFVAKLFERKPDMAEGIVAEP